MSDLIERLKAGVTQREVRWPGNDGSDMITDRSGASATMRQAASEIESLRSQLEDARRDALEKAAITAKLFTTSQHIAFDMQSGIFPKQSPIQDAIAAAIRSLSQEREG